MASCPNCAATLEADAETCSACGASFIGATSWKPIGTESHHSSGQLEEDAEAASLAFLAPVAAALQLFALAIGAAACWGGCGNAGPWTFAFIACVIGWYAIAKSASALSQLGGIAAALAIILLLLSLVVTGITTIFVVGYASLFVQDGRI